MNIPRRSSLTTQTSTQPLQSIPTSREKKQHESADELKAYTKKHCDYPEKPDIIFDIIFPVFLFVIMRLHRHKKCAYRLSSAIRQIGACRAVAEKTLSLRTSAHAGVAIPRIEGKCIDNCPTERETLRFLVIIVTWFLSTGGLPRPLRPQARPERNRRRRLLARRSVRTGLAMTAYF